MASQALLARARWIISTSLTPAGRPCPEWGRRGRGRGMGGGVQGRERKRVKRVLADNYTQYKTTMSDNIMLLKGRTGREGKR